MYFKDPELPPRPGTDVDAQNLVKTLAELHFHVHLYNDLNCNGIKSTLKGFSEMDHTDNDCILIVILSHGQFGCIYAKDYGYELDEIWSPFIPDRCPSLKGKPKLIFVQACQGEQLDEGILLRTQQDNGAFPHAHNLMEVPSDFLIACSTFPEFYSFRNVSMGSWFIQSLCEQLRKHGKEMTILTLMTMVCQKVALDFESNVPNNIKFHGKKQAPCINSKLTKLLVFYEKDVE